MAIITRNEASELLRELASNGSLKEEISDKLKDIAACIEEEQVGKHFWGGDEEEYAQIHTAYREDLWTDDLIAECQAIDEKYSFTPAPHEAEEIAEAIKEENEMWDDEEDPEAKPPPFT